MTPQPPHTTREIWVTPEEINALEDSHPAEQRWMTRDGGFIFGKRPDRGPIYREIQVGSHGNQSLSEASGPAQSAAQRADSQDGNLCLCGHAPTAHHAKSGRCTSYQAWTNTECDCAQYAEAGS